MGKPNTKLNNVEFFRSTFTKRSKFAPKPNRIIKKMIKGIKKLRLMLRDRFERVYTEDLPLGDFLYLWHLICLN